VPIRSCIRFLDGDTKYWLVVTTTDPTGTWAGWYINNTEELGRVGWRIQRDDFGNIPMPFCCMGTELQEAYRRRLPKRSFATHNAEESCH
jgi:hypothetical protein